MKTSLLLLLLLLAPVFAGSHSLLSDTLDIGVGSYRFVKFRITPEQADSTAITGEIHIEPDSSTLELILMTEMDYRRGWLGRTSVDSIAVIRSGSGPVHIEIPDFGDFVLVLSNRGNTESAVLSANLSVVYTGSGVVYDSLPFGMTLLLILMALGVVIAAVLLTLKRMSPGRG